MEQDRVADPGGEGLSRYLAAHLVLERRVRRRVACGQLAGVLGVPLWFAVLLHAPPALFYPVLAAFAVAALALGAAFARELVCRHSIREAAHSVRVARSGDRDQRVAPGK